MLEAVCANSLLKPISACYERELYNFHQNYFKYNTYSSELNARKSSLKEKIATKCSTM